MLIWTIVHLNYNILYEISKKKLFKLTKNSSNGHKNSSNGQKKIVQMDIKIALKLENP